MPRLLPAILFVTTVLYANRANCEEVVSQLSRAIRAGSDAEFLNVAKNTLSEEGFPTSVQGDVVEFGTPLMLKTLVEKGFQPNDLIHDVAESGDLEKIELLVNAGADLSRVDDNLVTPVRLAALRQKSHAYQRLVELSGGTEPTPNYPDGVMTEKSTADLISTAFDFRARQECKSACDELVVRGSVVVPAMFEALDNSDLPRSRYSTLYGIMSRMGPGAAKLILPRLEAQLTLPNRVTFARLTMNWLRPGHFEQLPEALRRRAVRTHTKAVLTLDRRRHPEAAYYSYWLPNKDILKLLRSAANRDHTMYLLGMNKPPLPGSPDYGPTDRGLLRMRLRTNCLGFIAMRKNQ